MSMFAKLDITKDIYTERIMACRRTVGMYYTYLKNQMAKLQPLAGKKKIKLVARLTDVQHLPVIRSSEFPGVKYRCDSEHVYFYYRIHDIACEQPELYYFLLEVKAAYAAAGIEMVLVDHAEYSADYADLMALVSIYHAYQFLLHNIYLGMLSNAEMLANIYAGKTIKFVKDVSEFTDKPDILDIGGVPHRLVKERNEVLVICTTHCAAVVERTMVDMLLSHKSGFSKYGFVLEIGNELD